MPARRPVLAAFLFLLTLIVAPAARAQSGTFSPEMHPDRKVTFRLSAPKATEVTLGGEFARGQRLAMTKGTDGVWSVTVGPLAPELYWYLFYSDGVPVVDPRNGNVKTGRSTVSLVQVPAAPPAFYEVRNVPHGSVTAHYYTSKSLGTTRRLVVYTPPGYDATKREKYPVLYLLHGAGDDETGWTGVGRANLILDNAIAEGKARPMLVVMPYGYPREPGANATPEERAQRDRLFGEDLLNDVIPFVERQYRVRTDAASRAIAGLSMGGNQTLTVGLGHPDRFGWIAAFSAGPRDPATFLSKLKPGASGDERIKLLWVGCGKEDGSIRLNEQFVAELKSRGIPHTWRATEGGHTWPVWRHYLYEVAPQFFQSSR